MGPDGRSLLCHPLAQFPGWLAVKTTVSVYLMSFFFQIETSGPNKDYFTEEAVLDRVPGLLLILAAIYLVMGLLGAIMICQPPEDWVRRKSLSSDDLNNEVELMEKPKTNAEQTGHSVEELCDSNEEDEYVTWKEALKMKEFYLLWVTRLSVVLITQVS